MSIMFVNDYQNLLGIFTQVSKAAHTGENLQGILQTIITHITDALNAKGSTILSLDPSSGELELIASTGLSDAYLKKEPILSRHVFSEIHEKEPVFIRNVTCDKRIQYPETVKAEGIQSMLGYPFDIVGGHRMVLRIYFDRTFKPDDNSLAFLRALVDQCAIAARYTLLQSRYFETFRHVSKAIHTDINTGDILNTIVTHISEIMEAKGSIFWIIDTAQQRIESKINYGFAYESLLSVQHDTLLELFPLDQNGPIFIKDARYDQRIPSLELLGKKQVVTIIGLPLTIAEPYKGILAVYFGRQRPVLQSEIDFIEALGEQGAIALHKALRYDENMLSTLSQTVEGFALAIEAKDTITHGHSLRVACYAKRLAQALKLDEKQIETVYHAGLLHDIGKIGMGDRLLNRLGKLTEREMDIMRKHPIIGAKIVAPLTCLASSVPLILHHHELYDGSGYPDGLKKNSIPLGARILTVCDAFETMLTGRVNMPKLNLGQAIKQLRISAGIMFDPEIVRIWIEIVKNDPKILNPPEAPAHILDKLVDTCDDNLKKNKFFIRSWFRLP
ncbi:MAG: HD domain-containing protein [Desulfobacteraceae bacterium]|nr:HD domain-containing protein [Desulfobacteraceae bacterium]